MRGEPVLWLQPFQKFLRRRRAKGVAFDLVLQKLLLTKQLVLVPKLRDPTRPIVAKEDVYLTLYLLQLEDIKLSNVIRRLHCVSRIRRSLVMPFLVIVRLKDPR